MYQSLPFLTPQDLDDPEQFVPVGPVPFIEVHQDPELGDVDEDLLKLLCDNNNLRACKGLYAALTCGHTRLPDAQGNYPPEDEQPEVWGYVSQWIIAPEPVNGKPCLWGLEHHMRAHADEAKTYHWRSVERLTAAGKGEPRSSDEYIDRVSLLRTPPRREVSPPLHYAKAGDPAVARVCYAACWPATETPTKDSETEENEEMPGFDHTNPDHVKALADQLGPHLGPHIRPHLRAALDEMIEAPGKDGEGAPEPKDLREEYNPQEASDVDARREYGGGGASAGGGDTAPARMAESRASRHPDDDGGYSDDYDDDGDNDDEDYEDEDGYEDEHDEDRDMEPERREREPEPRRREPEPAARGRNPGRNGVSRRRYQKDLGVVAEALTSHEQSYEELKKQIADQDEIIGEMLVERRRLRYQADLEKMISEEGIECSVEEEVAEIAIDTPPEFEPKRKEQIRKHYRRSLTRQPLVAVEGPSLPGSAGPITSQEMSRAQGLAYRKNISFSDALKEIRAGV